MRAKKRRYRKQSEKLDRALLGMSLVTLCVGMLLLVGMITAVFPEWMPLRTFARARSSLSARPTALRHYAAIGEESVYSSIGPAQIRVSQQYRSLALEEVGWAPGAGLQVSTRPPMVAAGRKMATDNIPPRPPARSTPSTPRGGFAPPVGQPAAYEGTLRSATVHLATPQLAFGPRLPKENSRRV